MKHRIIIYSILTFSLLFLISCGKKAEIPAYEKDSAQELVVNAYLEMLDGNSDYYLNHTLVSTVKSQEDFKAFKKNIKSAENGIEAQVKQLQKEIKEKGGAKFIKVTDQSEKELAKYTDSNGWVRVYFEVTCNNGDTIEQHFEVKRKDDKWWLYIHGDASE